MAILKRSAGKQVLLGHVSVTADIGRKLVKERVHGRIPVVIWAELPGAGASRRSAPVKDDRRLRRLASGRASLDGRDRRDKVAGAGNPASPISVLEKSPSTDPMALGAASQSTAAKIAEPAACSKAITSRRNRRIG